MCVALRRTRCIELTRKKEAVPIDPKQPRHLTTQGAKAPGADPNGAAKGARKPKKKKGRTVFGYILRIIGCVFCLGIMVCSVAAVLLSMYVVQVTADPEGKLDLERRRSEQSAIIYDRNGDEYDTMTSGNSSSIWRPLTAMPENLQNAVIAIEDKDFYSEIGVNFKRTIAAALNELTGQRLLGSQQGASTLEQQLVKNLTDDAAVDYGRKFREIFRAIGLSNRYSKETILEAYLNTVPLTGVIEGMEAGARSYFGKTVEELTLAECATLASISKNPTGYHPANNPENLLARRNHVLWEMLDQGYITQAEYDAATAETITLTENSAVSENVAVSSNYSYFTEALLDELTNDIMAAYGYETEAEAQEYIFTSGLRIYSTVDPYVQSELEKLMLNEPDENGSQLFPALWHEEEVESKIPVGTEYELDAYDHPVNPPNAEGVSTAVMLAEDQAVYNDDGTLKTGTYKETDENGNTGEYLTFYRNARTQAAMAVVSSELDHKGEVIAVGGGLGEKTVDNGLNRATTAHQTGSTMKPIAAYCLGIDEGWITYSTPLEDAPLYSAENKQMLDTEKAQRLGLSLNPNDPANQARNDIWRDWPSNFDDMGGDGDLMLVYDAIRQSYNTIAVRVGAMVGVDAMYDFVTETLGLRHLTADDANLAPLVLGSQQFGMTVVELANAYTMFTDGNYATAHYYTRVEDMDGNPVLDMTKVVNKTQAIDPESAVIMNRLLSNVWVSPGTARNMKPETEGIDAVGKTGTTSDFKDFTFAGLTPYYSVAIWWGYDRPYDMSLVQRGVDGKPTQRAFKQLMETVEAELPAAEFYYNDNVIKAQFNTSTGAIISSGGMTGYYTADNMPDESTGALLSAAEDPYAQAAQLAAQNAVDPAG